MNTRNRCPRASQLSDLDLLVERVGAWYADLMEAREHIQEVMAHPAVELFLNEPATRCEDTGRLDDPDHSSPRHPMLLPEGSSIPEALQMCTTQEDVAMYLAKLNDGVVDLMEATPLIRELGLSTANNDRGLRKNLGTRLVRSGRWAKVGTWKYQQLGWKAGMSDNGFAVAGMENSSSKNLDSKSAASGDRSEEAQNRPETPNSPGMVLQEQEER